MKNKPKLCKSCEKRNEDCEAWSLLQVFGDICNKTVTQKGWFWSPIKSRSTNQSVIQVCEIYLLVQIAVSTYVTVLIEDKPL